MLWFICHQLLDFTPHLFGVTLTKGVNMLVVFFLICINHSRYLISQTFISPKERRIIILCGSFIKIIPFIHQFCYICWYPGIWSFFKRIVLNGACFPLISKKCRFPFVPWCCLLDWNIVKILIRLNVVQEFILVETLHIPKTCDIMFVSVLWRTMPLDLRLSQKVIT